MKTHPKGKLRCVSCGDEVKPPPPAPPPQVLPSLCDTLQAGAKTLLKIASSN